jgi:hypothetical protein
MLEKYNPLFDHLAEKFKVNAGRVLPLVIGTRGCLPTNTIGVLQEINTTDRWSLITISLLALRS